MSEVLRLSEAKEASSQFSSAPPSDQGIIDIFQGEWSSAVPGLDAKPGHAALFEDARLHWANQIVPFVGKTVLELGPLEAAHTSLMLRMGAKSILAIEGNRRAFLRCLCIKEIFNLQGAKFLFGDFVQHLKNSNQQFDIAVASGVLYHMADPIDLLRRLTRISDNIILWTHYYDERIIQERADAHLFTLPDCSDPYPSALKIYPQEAIDWGGFSGGPDVYSRWLTRQSLLKFFSDLGFRTTISFDDPDHPNGPALSLYAQNCSPYAPIGDRRAPALRLRRAIRRAIRRAFVVRDRWFSKSANQQKTSNSRR